MPTEKRIEIDRLLMCTTTHMRQALVANMFRDPTWDHVSRNDNFFQAESNISAARMTLILARDEQDPEKRKEYVRRGCEDLVDAMNRLAFIIDNEKRILGEDPGIYRGPE